MMLQLAYVGLAMVATGLASFYAIDRAATFVLVNLIGGALALAAAGVLALQRLRLARSPDSLRAILLGTSKIALALIAGVGLELAADRSGVRFDWTFDRRFEIAPSTIEACKAVGAGLRATLFHTTGLIREFAERVCCWKRSDGTVRCKWMSGRSSALRPRSTVSRSARPTPSSSNSARDSKPSSARAKARSTRPFADSAPRREECWWRCAAKVKAISSA